MTAQRPRRTGAIWAAVGGAVLVAGVIALLLGMLNRPAESGPTPSPNLPTGSSPSTSPPESSGAVVDETAAASGWVPEPITTDPDAYIRAALSAASMFDTTLSSRDEWLNYLDTWFTPDTRYAETERQDRMDAARLEMRQGVVLPQPMWDSLAIQHGRVRALVVGDVSLTGVPEDATGAMSIGTADVQLTFTQEDGAGTEASYTEDARVSVQVLCGADSVPTPQSDQRAGDCKLVRFFTEPVED